MSLRSKWFEYCVARDAYMSMEVTHAADNKERKNSYKVKRNQRRRMRDLRTAWKRAVRQEGLTYKAIMKPYNNIVQPTASVASVTNFMEYGYRLSDGRIFNIEEPL